MSYRIQKHPPASECFLRCEYTVWGSLPCILLFMFGLPALLAFACSWVMGYRTPAMQEGLQWGLALLVLSLPAIYVSLTHKPSLAFYREGLWIGDIGLIPWREITKAEAYTRGNSAFEGRSVTGIISYRPPANSVPSLLFSWMTLFYYWDDRVPGCRCYSASNIDFSVRSSHLRGLAEKNYQRLGSLITACAAAHDEKSLIDLLHKAGKGHF